MYTHNLLNGFRHSKKRLQQIADMLHLPIENLKHQIKQYGRTHAERTHKIRKVNVLSKPRKTYSINQRHVPRVKQGESVHNLTKSKAIVN
jgi:hypothetical protein